MSENCIVLPDAPSVKMLSAQIDNNEGAATGAPLARSAEYSYIIIRCQLFYGPSRRRRHRWNQPPPCIR